MSTNRSIIARLVIVTMLLTCLLPTASRAYVPYPENSVKAIFSPPPVNVSGDTFLNADSTGAFKLYHYDFSDGSLETDLSPPYAILTNDKPFLTPDHDGFVTYTATIYTDGQTLTDTILEIQFPEHITIDPADISDSGTLTDTIVQWPLGTITGKITRTVKVTVPFMAFEDSILSLQTTLTSPDLITPVSSNAAYTAVLDSGIAFYTTPYATITTAEEIDPVRIPLSTVPMSTPLEFDATLAYLSETSKNTRTFIGKETDSATGLTYFGARYYDPLVGRFTAQDPFNGAIRRPASLGRYAYGANNPLRNVDPMGFDYIDVTQGNEVHWVIEEDRFGPFNKERRRVPIGNVSDQETPFYTLGGVVQLESDFGGHVVSLEDLQRGVDHFWSRIGAGIPENPYDISGLGMGHQNLIIHHYLSNYILPFGSPYEVDYRSKAGRYYDDYNVGIRLQGAAEVAAASGEASAAGTLMATPEPTMLTKAASWALFAHAVDLGSSGLKKVLYGDPSQAYTSQGIQYGLEQMGVNHATAEYYADTLNLIGGGAGTAYVLRLSIFGTQVPASISILQRSSYGNSFAEGASTPIKIRGNRLYALMPDKRGGNYRSWQLMNRRTTSLSNRGRFGSPATRSHIEGIVNELESRGWTVTNYWSADAGELYLPGFGGGTKGASWIDITATKNGRILHINTIDTLADGVTPTARELTNTARIRVQLKAQYPGEIQHLLLIPKPW